MNTIQKSCGLAAFALAALSQAALAGEVDKTVTGSTTEAKVNSVELLPYTSVVTKGGEIVINLDDSAKAVQGTVKRDVLTVFAPNVRFTEKILHSQDWYLQVDPNGTMQGIYTVPRNQSLPSQVLRGMGEGFGLLKVNPANSFFKVFPSKYELASQLTTFMEAARETTCKASKKPETISASVDVKPGWTGSGQIKFSATWAVKDLCDKKS